MMFEREIDPERFAYDVFAHQLPRFQFPRERIPQPDRPRNRYRWTDDQIRITCRTVTMFELGGRDEWRKLFQLHLETGAFESVAGLSDFARETFAEIYKDRGVEEHEDPPGNRLVIRTAACLAMCVELALFLHWKGSGLPFAKRLPGLWSEFYESHLRAGLEAEEGGLNALKRMGDLQNGMDHAYREFIRSHALPYEKDVSAVFKREKPRIHDHCKPDLTDVEVHGDTYVFLDLKREMERKRRGRRSSGADTGAETPEMDLRERLGGALPVNTPRT